MPISDNAAADAFYDALKANLAWTPGSPDDATARAAWRAAFSAFLDYVKAHAIVNVGIAVQVNPTTGTGATTGTGTIS